jgi:hypothetical protein
VASYYVFDVENMGIMGKAIKAWIGSVGVNGWYAARVA